LSDAASWAEVAAEEGTAGFAVRLMAPGRLSPAREMPQARSIPSVHWFSTEGAPAPPLHRRPGQSHVQRPGAL